MAGSNPITTATMRLPSVDVRRDISSLPRPATSDKKVRHFRDCARRRWPCGQFRLAGVWGGANAVPVIFCKAGERKGRVAAEYVDSRGRCQGVLVLVAKARHRRGK